MDTERVATIRAEIARARVPLYIVGARARIHPVRLSQILNGRVRLTRELEARITAAIQIGAAEAGNPSAEHFGSR